MKIYRMLLLGLSFPVLLFAAGPAPQPITIDSQSRVVAGQEVYRASARTFRLSFVDNGTATDITGYTPFMTWSTSNTASICYTSVASVVSATGGVADCAFSSAQLDYAAGTYIFEAGLVDDPIVFRQGVFRIRASPYGQGTGAAIATTNLNWAAIGNTGTESSPFALKTRTITIDGVSGMLTNSLTFSTAGSTNTPAVYLSVTNIADSAPHLTLTRTDAHTITVTETGFGTAADSNASAFVAAGDVALAAALTNVTGNAEIVVTGAGRTRMLSIAATIARDAEVIAATGALDEVAFDGEVDPVFAESVAVSITAAATQEWATAYGWGNHAMAGYAGTGDLADVVADVDVLQTGKAAVVHAHVWPDLTDGGTVSQNMANASDAASASRDAALSNAVVALYGAADTALSNNVLIAADTAAASRDTSLSNNFVAVVGGATNDAVADATNRVAGMGFLTAESDPLALLANGTRELAADLDVDGYNLRHVNTIYFTNSAWWHPYDYPLEPYFFWSTRNSAGPTWWPNDLYLVRPTPYAYHEETGIVWCAWNDGSGSGLDADALDGQHFLGVSNTMVGISAAATNALETEITWRGYLKTESDSLWVAWVTNAAAGSTNAILPDGTLVDIGGLLGETDSVDSNTLQDAVFNGGVVTNGIVTIDAANQRTNTFGGMLTVLGDAVLAGRSVWGIGLDVVDIVARGGMQTGTNTPTATRTIGDSSDGALQRGHVKGTMTVSTSSDGASQAGYVNTDCTMTIGANSSGAYQSGKVEAGEMTIGADARGAFQSGLANGASIRMSGGCDGSVQFGRASAWPYDIPSGFEMREDSAGSIQAGAALDGGIMQINQHCDGCLQLGSHEGYLYVTNNTDGTIQAGQTEATGIMGIMTNADGAFQFGRVEGQMIVGGLAYGAGQVGIVAPNATATNWGKGALQLLSLEEGQRALTTPEGESSLMLGAGVLSNKNSIVVGDGSISHEEGSVTISGIYHGNGSGLSNIVGVVTGGTITASNADSFDVADGAVTLTYNTNVFAGAADTALSNNVLIAADTAAASRDTSLSNNFVAVVGGATNDAVADATNRVAGMGFLTVESDPLFAGWLTNSAAGSTNAVLSDGALVDIGELLGETTEADTLAAVTARGATTPTAITVSNDVTVGTGHFLYAPLFRSYSGASFGSSACWTTAPYRYEFGMCPEMQAFVFNPCGAATNSATHWPLVIVATPGKRTQYNMYSEALRVETNGNVTLGGDLDMGGYSVLNVGTGTIHFVDGSRISAPAVQRWDRASGGARRAEGPASALAIYLAGWLAGKRKRAWDWLRRLRKVAPVLLLVLAGASAFGDQQNDVHILVEAHGQEGAGGEWCEQIFSDGSRVGSCGHLRAPTDLLPLSAADLAEIKTAISALATSVLDYVETSGLMQHYMLHFYDLRVCPDEGRSIMIENLFDGVGNGCREERRLRGSHAEKIRKHIGRAPL